MIYMKVVEMELTLFGMICFAAFPVTMDLTLLDFRTLREQEGSSSPDG